MKKIFLGVLVLLVSVALFSATSAKKNTGAWRLDGNSSAELRNFRLMTGDWQNTLRGEEPTRQGLDSLHASASAQPSELSLAKIRETVLDMEPNAKIFIVDLRQESHGFANSLPVSYHMEHNAANAGKTTAEVERTEIELLNSLRGVETTFKPMGKADVQIFKPVTIVPRVMTTEREYCEKIGVNYVRFAAADMQFPSPEVVDDYLEFLATIPQNSWLHFHCHAGHGRTTTFLVMYDILENPDVSLEDICKRQYLLGGTNLLLEPEGDDWGEKMARDRAKKIRLFYEFAQGTRAEQIGLPWSEWLAERTKQ